MTTISFYNQGCRLNQAETSLLENSFSTEGYQIVAFTNPADIVVINTCTVTENGDHDTRRLVNKINRLNPRAKIALVGCQAQILKESLLKLPNVFWVVGNALKMNLKAIVQEHQETPVVLAPKMEKTTFSFDEVGVDTHHTRANLKIQDGCDFYCSFCVIPFARGPARSRDFDNILQEAQHLVTAGHQELILTGINIGTYHHQEKTLLDVLKALETIPNLKRIRISSIEPTTIDPALLHHMAESTILCPYLHLPLQSGSDTILEGMARKYTTQEFQSFMEKALNIVPNLCVGTDVIVGFPGETDSLFAETEHFLRELPFAYFHVFSYSERKFARSQKLAQKIPTQIIAHRSKILRELSTRKRYLYAQKFLSTPQDVLFEQNKKGHWIGLTPHYLKVSAHSEENLQNCIRPVYLESFSGDSFIGRLG